MLQRYIAVSIKQLVARLNLKLHFLNWLACFRLELDSLAIEIMGVLTDRPL